jgi:hypothetical protein
MVISQKVLLFRDLADSKGRTVAHAAAEKGYLPKGFTLWEVTDSQGRIVEGVAMESGDYIEVYDEETDCEVSFSVDELKEILAKAKQRD